MEKLPKIVLQRLRQGAAGANPKVSPASSGRANGAEHPDADLLTAFVERKLTDGERASVMAHLANCDQCREVVALAFPPRVEETPPIKAVERRPAWFNIPIVRWGAIATALGAILFTVFLYRPAPQLFRERTMEETKHPPAPDASTAPVKPEAVVPTANETRTDTVPRRVDAKPEARSASTNHNQPAAKQVGAAGEVARFAAPSETSSTKALPAKAEPSTGYSVGGPLRSAAPTPTAAPGPEQPVAAKTANAEMGHTQIQTFEGAKDKSDAAAKSRKAAALAAVQRAEGAPRVQGLLESGGALPAPAATNPAKALLPTVRWSISNAGKVERSVDGGTAWEELHVNDSLVFRVVTAAGSEVWAGGARGSLYHSVDGGESWTRVYLNPDRSGPDDAIVGINFTDPLHGRVTTAGDERWITSDGGRHWTQE